MEPCGGHCSSHAWAYGITGAIASQTHQLSVSDAGATRERGSILRRRRQALDHLEQYAGGRFSAATEAADRAVRVTVASEPQELQSERDLAARWCLIVVRVRSRLVVWRRVYSHEQAYVHIRVVTVSREQKRALRGELRTTPITIRSGIDVFPSASECSMGCIFTKVCDEEGACARMRPCCG